MHAEFLSFGSSHVNFSRWGKGTELWIGIHGYGESSESFDFLSGEIPADQYTLIAPDLPFHGRTEWKEGLEFSADDLVDILDAILNGLGRDGASFKLLGFSMGGRIALCLAEKIPERITKLVLLAPDGLNMSRWYWLATQNPMGNQLLLMTIRHPAWLFILLKLGKLCRIIDPEYFKYATHFIQDQGAREDLYHRWTILRKFKPDLNGIKSCILRQKFRVELVFAQNDPLIRPEKGDKFKRGIEAYCGLTLVHGGHQILQEKNARIILPLMKD